MTFRIAFPLGAGMSIRRTRSRYALSTIGTLALVALGLGCSSDSSTGGSDPLSKVPDFLYVSNASGSNQIYKWHAGTSTLFAASIAGDVEPQSASGKVVWTSYRISFLNAEIFIANNDGSNAIRLTNDSVPDNQPSLSPDGNTVVYTSLASGTPRIWTMGADGSNKAALATGAGADVPETSARYSPGGGRLLFSSPRTNTTQIWIMPTDGSPATQLTHEANGAFDGSWSSDGKSVFYVDGSDRTKIHNIVIASGVVTDYVTGGVDVGDQSCTASVCLVVTGATSNNGDIDAYVGSGTQPLALLITDRNENEPAVLIR
jgi:WD40 repeat protein